MAEAQTYSFKNIVCALNGPGGSINLGQGAAVASEGITFAQTGDKSAMTIGSDGAGMHTMSADDSGTVTVRLLKTSPVNAQLMQLYNYQTGNSLYHGRNTITLRDIARGDVQTATGVAFKKKPDVTYSAEGSILEWTFDAIKIDGVLGIGSPER